MCIFCTCTCTCVQCVYNACTCTCTCTWHVYSFFTGSIQWNLVHLFMWPVHLVSMDPILVRFQGEFLLRVPFTIFNPHHWFSQLRDRVIMQTSYTQCTCSVYIFITFCCHLWFCYMYINWAIVNFLLEKKTNSLIWKKIFLKINFRRLNFCYSH